MIRKKRRNQRKVSLGKALKLGLFLVVGLGMIALMVFLWPSGSDELTLVVNASPEEVWVTTFDFGAKEITNLVIPGSTQLLASHQLGTWKISSLWQLGENEHLGGSLLKDSVVANFHFPVEFWAGRGAVGFSRGGFKSAFEAAFLPYQTNLTLKQKIRLGIFAMGVADKGSMEINLARTSYLTQTKLIGGEDGYLITSSVPESLLGTFAEDVAEGRVLKLAINDFSGRPNQAEKVGATLEMLGFKVAAINKGTKVETLAGGVDCLVVGRNNRLLVEKIARIFSCQKKFTAPSGNFDLEISLTSSFAERF